MRLVKRDVNCLKNDLTTLYTRLRQLLAVVIILITILIQYNSDSTINKTIKEANKNLIEEEQNKSIEKFIPVSGISEELQKIQKDETIIKLNTDKSSKNINELKEEVHEVQEVQEIENKRKNTLYYVREDFCDFYLAEEYQDYLWNKLEEYNHTDLYEICLAQMYHESKFTINIVSETHDHGLMQVNASNYEWLNNTLGINSLDDPYNNIDSGVYILITNYNKYDNIEEALIAYNQGYCGEVKSTEYSQCILTHDIKCLRVLN